MLHLLCSAIPCNVVAYDATYIIRLRIAARSSPCNDRASSTAKLRLESASFVRSPWIIFADHSAGHVAAKTALSTSASELRFSQ